MAALLKPADNDGSSSANVARNTTARFLSASQKSPKDEAGGCETWQAVVVEGFRNGRPLGRGKFGSIYLAQSRANTLSLSRFAEGSTSEGWRGHQLRREIEINPIYGTRISQVFGYFYDDKRIYPFWSSRGSSTRDSPPAPEKRGTVHL